MHSHAHHHEEAAEGIGRTTIVRHERRIWAVSGLSALAAIALLVGGRLGGSASLTGEGLHMLAHVTAFGLAGLGYVLAQRLSDRNRPDAARRVLDAAGALNGLVLLLLAAELFWISLGLSHPHGFPAFWPALGLALAGLVINVGSVLILSHSHRGEHGHAADVNYGAVTRHVIGDTIVGLLAIAALVGGRAFNWTWADAAAGFAGAAVLGALGLRLLVLAWRGSDRRLVTAPPTGARTASRAG